MAGNRLPSSNELASERTRLAEVRSGLADKRTALAVKRTIVAFDRTLMAWVRTSTALISFGFTIYKFFQYLRSDDSLTAAQRMHILSPRGLALVMIGLGVIGLVLAAWDHRRQVSELRSNYHAYGPFRPSLAGVLATIVSGLGVLGFVLVVLRQ